MFELDSRNKCRWQLSPMSVCKLLATVPLVINAKSKRIYQLQQILSYRIVIVYQRTQCFYWRWQASHVSARRAAPQVSSRRHLRLQQRSGRRRPRRALSTEEPTQTRGRRRRRSAATWKALESDRIGSESGRALERVSGDATLQKKCTVQYMYARSIMYSYKAERMYSQSSQLHSRSVEALP